MISGSSSSVSNATKALAKALVALDTLELDPEIIHDTAGILFKQREDVAALQPMISELLAPANPA